MAENNNLIPTEPDWDGTPLSRAEEILYSIIHTEEWDGTPMSRGEYFLVQLKDAIENISMMDIKGTVPTVADLPSTGNKKGDVYSVGPEEQLNKPEYYWDGEAWQYLGQIVDLSGYLPLTGGTMTGNLDFSIGGKTISIGVSNNETQIVSAADTFRIANSKNIEITNASGYINLKAGANQPAVSINQDGRSTTKIWGGNKTEVTSSSNTEISADAYTTIKGHRSNNTDTNTITLNSTGITETTSGAKSTTATGNISETTAAKKVVTTATGIELGTTAQDNVVSVSTTTKKLSVSSQNQVDVTSGGDMNITATGNTVLTSTYGETTVLSPVGIRLVNTSQNATTTAIRSYNQNLSLETTGSSGISLSAAGSIGATAQHGPIAITATESSTTVSGASGVTVSGGKGGVSITADKVGNTTGYVTATHGATVPASDSTNKVATTAFVHSITDDIVQTIGDINTVLEEVL